MYKFSFETNLNEEEYIDNKEEYPFYFVCVCLYLMNMSICNSIFA